MPDFDRKAYALEELQRLLETLGPEARILMDNLPYSAVVGWPFVREDGTAGMQTILFVWDGAFAIALDHETHEVYMVRQHRLDQNGKEVVRIEIPGGGIDPGRTALRTAGNELLEEAGVTVIDQDDWIMLFADEYKNPLAGIVLTKQYCFLALRAKKVAEPSGDDQTQVTTMKLSELIALDNRDGFHDDWSPYCLRRVQDFLRENHPELLT